MRIFLTGATGHVGGALLSAFRAGGHEVTALVRGAAGAATVSAAGATPLVGGLAEVDAYRDAAAASDGIVHAAFEYHADGSESSALDERATLALAEVARAGRFIYTSSAYQFRTRGGVPVDEDAPVGEGWRFALERRVVDAGATVVRLGFVYGGSRGGTLPDLFAAAVRAGRLGQVGSGTARGSYIHREDLAALYRLALERGATGIFHAVDGRPLPAREALQAICRAVGVSETIAPLAPGETLGLDPHTLDILDRDVAVVAPRSFALGWRPRLADLHAGVASAYAEWKGSHVRVPG